MRRGIIVLLFAVVGVALAACGRKTAVESPLVTPAFTSPLEVQQTTSPIPTPRTPVQHLSLNEPIYSEDTEVSGSGPAGLPICLYDVGLTGNELGSGVIGEDATFSIELNTALRVGQRVGLALGDLEGTSFTRDDLNDQAIIDLPVIGLLFADVTVQPQP